MIKKEFFVNVSHELKTPLSIINSANQLIEVYSKMITNDVNQSKILNNVSTITQSCNRLTKLINNIMDLSKIEAGYFELKLSNEDLVYVVKNIVDAVRGYVQAKKLFIDFKSNVRKKIIAMDVEKIERVLLNLISNAIKFSNPGNEIHVTVTELDDSVKISVRDYGIGIDQEHLARLFQRFYQVDKSLHRNAEGTGIGLAIVQTIVTMHDGKMMVESTVGEGSVFFIELPVREIEIQNQSMKLISELSEKINIEFSDIE